MTRQKRTELLEAAYTRSTEIRHAVAELENILQALEDAGCPLSPSVAEYTAGVGQDALMLQAHLLTALSLALNWREEDDKE